MFMESVKQNGDVLYHPIKRNVMDFFSSQMLKDRSSKEKVLKEDCQIFSRMFISCQTTQCDLQQFFKHENQPTPAALSENGKLHACQKSQLVEILETVYSVEIDSEPTCITECLLIDGSALANSLVPKAVKSFDDYA